MTNTPTTILTGIRSNEEPTLGNYLGAFLPMIEMQKKYSSNDYRINMFLPDLHSFTTPINHDDLYANTVQNLKYFVAAGLNLDQKNTLVYRQSYVPAHSELTWILDCFTYFGEMSRMTQFKEKSQEHESGVTLGLFNYPVLMAADILLYNATWVPVGEDQFQHVEITRNLAQRFNAKFRAVFPDGVFVEPETTQKQMAFIERDNGLRIRSLTDPRKKMSKSSTDEKSKILLKDSPDIASKKIMAATTDSVGVINFDWTGQPGITSLLQIMALLSGRDQEEVNKEWVGTTKYGDFKKAVAAVVAEFLQTFHQSLSALSDDYLLEKLVAAERKANETANATLLRAQQAVGLRPRNQ